MPGILSMAAALKGFEKSGKVSRLSDDGAYRLTIVRLNPAQATPPPLLPSSPSTSTLPSVTISNDPKKQYVLEVRRTPRKDTPKALLPNQPELSMRFESLEKVLVVANQALKGGFEAFLLFQRPHQS